MNSPKIDEQAVIEIPAPLVVGRRDEKIGALELFEHGAAATPVDLQPAKQKAVHASSGTAFCFAP